MTWRDARSIDVLRDEVNDRWPKRDTLSDGTKGDASHAARASDHNPNAAGVVRARDIDDDLRGGESDPFWLFEHIRKLGKAGFAPLQNGGYVIYFAKIASERDNWAVRDYTGPNAHKTHIHVSVSRDADRYDDTTSWMFDVVPITDNPKPRPTRRKPVYVVSIQGSTKSALFLTDGLTIRTLSKEALIHGRNEGIYPLAEIEIPKDHFNWLVNNTAGANVPDAV